VPQHQPAIYHHRLRHWQKVKTNRATRMVAPESMVLKNLRRRHLFLLPSGSKSTFLRDYPSTVVLTVLWRLE